MVVGYVALADAAVEVRMSEAQINFDTVMGILQRWRHLAFVEKLVEEVECGDEPSAKD